MPPVATTASGSSPLVTIGMLVISKPVDPVHFQRAIILMQSRLDFNVMPLMFSYRLAILNAVALSILVILQHIIISISADVSRNIRLSDPMRRLSLLVVLIMLFL